VDATAELESSKWQLSRTGFSTFYIDIGPLTLSSSSSYQTKS
jgi:hypothetical protein